MTDGAGVLQVHRAERADALAEALAALVAVPLPDPFAAEIVAVPAKGVERWLAQRLSHRLGVTAGHGDGVCAGVEFPSPSALVAGVVAAMARVDPADDPWRPARLVWPLLEVMDECAGEQWCAPLGAHLGFGDRTGVRRGRRYATARRLAELFSSYATHRPEMLGEWRGGAEVEGDLGWQPELWRRLRARVGLPDPAQRLEAACAALHTHPERAGLPERLSLFGPTRLPAEHLAVLAALAEHREVHLWLPHPSPALWAGVAAAVPVVRVPSRRADPTAGAASHPLLSSLGRDVRELQVRLAVAAPGAAHHHHPPAESGSGSGSGSGSRAASTLLRRLQQHLHDDRPPALPEPLPAGDRSVQVHACHGPDRQVEVLREIVVGLLADDPTLEPRDILVMCPDIETFAPLVSAGFGLGERRDDGHPGHRLQVRLADRALRQVNPLLDIVATVLELADSRLTASQALDLLSSGPVRLRFRLDDSDLERLRVLAARSGVRWGLDGAHRGPYRLDGFRQNTWAAGLDRLLLGVTMSGWSAPEGSGDPGGGTAETGDEWLGTALPMAEVDAGDTERIGRLAEFVDRLAAVLDSLSGERPLVEWITALRSALELLADTTGADSWQASQAHAELAAAARGAGPHARTVPLGLADVRGLLAERLRGRPSRAGFRTGTITVATLVPMRSVPHRVVCLLGIDDGVFPRAGVADGDDLLARDPLVGERDARSEDRQLLLDAIGAATEHLVVVHSGADERTGARRPPAVPLGELLDAIEAMTGPAGRVQVVARHPLQPFDTRNFTPGALAPARAFSFDRAELAGAVAAAGPKAPPAAFLPAPLPPVSSSSGSRSARSPFSLPPDPSEGGVVALDELVTFLEHPVKGFLRQRVGLPTWAADDRPADALPVHLDALATWAVGDRLLRDRLAGHGLERCRQAEWRRGELPPGALGDALLHRVLDDVEPLVAAAAPMRAGAAEDRDVDVELPDGRRVVGTLGGLHDRTLLRVEYSRLAPKHRIRAWVRLVALAASTGEPWRAATLGRGQRQGLSSAIAGPLEQGAALAALVDLVALRDEGLCEPLPLPTVTAYTYARARCGGADPDAAADEAMKKWTTGAGAERADDAHQRVWGPSAGREVLMAAPGPPGGEPSRFGTLALTLWAPILLAEDVVRL